MTIGDEAMTQGVAEKAAGEISRTSGTGGLSDRENEWAATAANAAG
jgi:hypothetical protein